jgi:hypothetical protein
MNPLDDEMVLVNMESCQDERIAPETQIFVAAASDKGYWTNRAGELELQPLIIRNDRSVCYNARQLFGLHDDLYIETWLYKDRSGALVVFLANIPETGQTFSPTPVAVSALGNRFLKKSRLTPPCREQIVAELIKTGIIPRDQPAQGKKIWDYHAAVCTDVCPELKRDVSLVMLSLDLSGETYAGETFAGMNIDPQKMAEGALIQIAHEVRDASKKHGRYALQIGLPGHAALLLGEGQQMFFLESRNYQIKFRAQEIADKLEQILGSDYTVKLLPRALRGVQDIESTVPLSDCDPQGYCATWALIIANSFLYTALSVLDIMLCLARVDATQLRDLARKVNASMYEMVGGPTASIPMFQGGEGAEARAIRARATP